MKIGLSPMWRSLLSVAAVALILSACSTTESDTAELLRDDGIANITWGEPSDGYPNVGTLAFFSGGIGPFSCSGTMIAPRVMLTAAHCLEESGSINEATWVRFDQNAQGGLLDYVTFRPDGSVSSIDWLGWFGNDYWLDVETVIAHPEWSDYAAFPATYDIGVVILSEPVDFLDPEEFAVLPDVGFLENLRGRERQDFVSVGYGRQGTLPPFSQNLWVKHEGAVRLLEVSSRLSGKGTQSAKFSNNPGIGGGTCYGDSGGPTFYQDSNLLVAVTSFGWAKNGNCVGNDFNFRTDLQTAHDFINEVLAEYGD